MTASTLNTPILPPYKRLSITFDNFSQLSSKQAAAADQVLSPFPLSLTKPLWCRLGYNVKVILRGPALDYFVFNFYHVYPKIGLTCRLQGTVSQLSRFETPLALFLDSLEPRHSLSKLHSREIHQICVHAVAAKSRAAETT